jgi:long-chain acyl-CoA synthetase
MSTTRPATLSGTFATVQQAVRATMARVPDRVAVQVVGSDESWTYDRVRQRADAIAGGLASLGVGHGSTVAMLMGARPEFPIVDLAAQSLGATAFSIYLTSSPEQVAYLLSDAGAEVAIVDPAYGASFFAARDQVASLKTVVALEPVDGVDLTLADLERIDPGFDPSDHIAQIKPDDVVTLIYTSGTTGPAKGVELTNTNILAAVDAWDDHLGLPDEFRIISWLPSAHVAERVAHLYLPTTLGGTAYSLANTKEIAAAMLEARPTFFFSPPRMWEKMKAGIQAKVSSLPDEQRAGAEKAIDAALQRHQLLQDGQPVPEALEEAYAAGEAALFSGLRAGLGLDQCRNAVSGSAPIAGSVLDFFCAIGLPFSEGWGMSETCGNGSLTPIAKPRVGTVGRFMKGNEIAIADDGEILMRGASVMKGYRNKPEMTAETIDVDGWLHSGDLGEIDEVGYLKIVGRKKDIIINSGGKNMSPHIIESTVKNTSPLIGQCLVIGDARVFNTMLIVLDPEYAAAWAAERGITFDDLAELATDQRLVAEVQSTIDRANANLSRVEQIKHFHVVPGEWLPDSDVMTPTMKLKRKEIERKYADEIERMYQP